MEAIQRGVCWIAMVVDEDGALLGPLTDGDVRLGRSVLVGTGAQILQYVQVGVPARSLQRNK